METELTINVRNLVAKQENQKSLSYSSNAASSLLGDTQCVLIDGIAMIHMERRVG